MQKKHLKASINPLMKIKLVNILFLQRFDGMFNFLNIIFYLYGSGYLNKFILLVLLVTCCLTIAGCSNNRVITKNESKTSTPVKVERINKAWYKHI